MHYIFQYELLKHAITNVTTYGVFLETSDGISYQCFKMPQMYI